MDKLLSDELFSRYTLAEKSNALSLYSRLKTSYFDPNEVVPSNSPIVRYDQEFRTKIENPKNLDKLMMFMRYQLLPDTRRLLFNKLLEREDEVIHSLQSMLLSTAHPPLIDNAVYLLIHCKGDHCSWLMQNINEMYYPYTQSIMCLVLGFRGNEAAASFLIYQLNHFYRRYVDDSLLQAPLLALYEMKSRFPDL